MKLVSWNVNGLAACKRKGFLKSIARLRADIVCCQEVRTNCPLNTPEYLQYWNLAEQSGYSGTLILAKKEPRSVQYGLGIDQLDCEGRLIALEYDSFCIVNVYVPNSQSSDERLDYRIAWDQALLDFLDRLNKPAILCGDFNVARSYLDVYPENLRNEENPPGFLSDEREGMERLLTRGYVDVFRALHPEKTSLYLVVQPIEQTPGKPGLAAGLFPGVRRPASLCPKHGASHRHSGVRSLSNFPDPASRASAKGIV